MEVLGTITPLLIALAAIIAVFVGLFKGNA